MKVKVNIINTWCVICLSCLRQLPCQVWWWGLQWFPRSRLWGTEYTSIKLKADIFVPESCFDSLINLSLQKYFQWLLSLFKALYAQSRIQVIAIENKQKATQTQEFSCVVDQIQIKQLTFRQCWCMTAVTDVMSGKQKMCNGSLSAELKQQPSKLFHIKLKSYVTSPPPWVIVLISLLFSYTSGMTWLVGLESSDT